MGCCALGTCVLSKALGGPGCYLCDVVAKLPQPKKLSRDLDALADAAEAEAAAKLKAEDGQQPKEKKPRKQARKAQTMDRLI
jgi:hypothetical protein